jgi:hypothetical protein
MKTRITGCIAASLAALAGTAAAGTVGTIALTPTDLIPESIAHPDVLGQHAIAQRLLPMLPKAHREAIEAAGGFGAELAERAERPARRGVMSLPTETVESVLTPEFLASIDDNGRAMVTAMGESIRAGRIIPMVCFAPDADPAVIAAVNKLHQIAMNTNGSRYQGTDRWTVTATDGLVGSGNPITLTYSFVPDGTFIPDLGIGVGSGSSVLFNWLNGIYGSPSNWQPLFAQVFARWSELIGVTYAYEPNDDGANTNSVPGVLGVRGDIRIGAFNLANDSINGGTLAYNNFPNDGDMIFDTDNFFNNTASNSRRLRNVAAHEHGHGLGMLHVCPINNTKLMEPFATTAFDGPQLDDILGGQRRYGDKFEPQSDDPSNPPALGSYGVGGFFGLQNVSIDDDSDIDVYKFTLTEPAEVQITVAPDAGAYSQGPQVGACTTGSFTDYNAIHDLQIFLLNTSFIPLGSANATGIGGSEQLNVQVLQPGDYLIQVFGSTANNIQRYQMGVFLAQTDVPCTADLAAPFGILNIFDLQAYINLYNSQDPSADLAAPFGTFNIFDLQAYINVFNQGCP